MLIEIQKQLPLRLTVCKKSIHPVLNLVLFTKASTHVPSLAVRQLAIMIYRVIENRNARETLAFAQKYSISFEVQICSVSVDA